MEIHYFLACREETIRKAVRLRRNQILCILTVPAHSLPHIVDLYFSIRKLFHLLIIYPAFPFLDFYIIRIKQILNHAIKSADEFCSS